MKPVKADEDGTIFVYDYRARLVFCRGNRPLVLNFGSWSCPVFRARTQEFLSIVRQFRDVVDFLTVYIEEAHPSNGWAFEVSTKIPLKLFPFSKRK